MENRNQFINVDPKLADLMDYDGPDFSDFIGDEWQDEDYSDEIYYV